MNKLRNLLAFTFCALTLVAAQAGRSPSKGGRPYPNELPILKIYEQAKWNSLNPYVSTVDDIEKALGKPRRTLHRRQRLRNLTAMALQI